jgi:hypothetical protein
VVDALLPVLVELRDQQRRIWMIHPFEKGADRCSRGRRGKLKCRAEDGRIGPCLTPGKIIAEHRQQDGIVAPPVLGACDGSARRRPRIEPIEIFQGKIHCPNGKAVEIGDDLIRHPCAVAALGESSQSRAGKHPVRAMRVLHHGFQRYRIVGKQRACSSELRGFAKLAWMRRIGSEPGQSRFELMQLGSKRKLLIGRNDFGRRRMLHRCS